MKQRILDFNYSSLFAKEFRHILILTLYFICHLSAEVDLLESDELFEV